MTKQRYLTTTDVLTKVTPLAEVCGFEFLHCLRKVLEDILDIDTIDLADKGDRHWIYNAATRQFADVLYSALELDEERR